MNPRGRNRSRNSSNKGDGNKQNQNRSRRSRGRRRSGGDGRSSQKANEQKKIVELEKQFAADPLRYGVVFFETFAEAKGSLTDIKAKSSSYDQLNIVIRSDGDMDDPELTEAGKVFAGEAWTLVHRRRQDDGWYDEAR